MQHGTYRISFPIPHLRSSLHEISPLLPSLEYNIHISLIRQDIPTPLNPGLYRMKCIRLLKYVTEPSRCVQNRLERIRLRWLWEVGVDQPG